MDGGSLLCLNLRREHAGQLDFARIEAFHNAAQLLGEARACGAPVVHAYSLTARADRECGAIAGLEPLPNEPVYVLQSLSAFSDADFADAVRARGALRVIGAVYSRVGLATLLGAQELGVPVELIRGACFAPRDGAVCAADLMNLIQHEQTIGAAPAGLGHHGGNVVQFRSVKQ